MKKDKSNKKVYAAMSGGVDSSVAAALLKKEGYFVIGVFFKPWTPALGASRQSLVAGYCTWQQDRQDAMRVCAKLGIPFKTWDFSKEYEKGVVRYMINSYKAGITPNPDVMCNKEIKFGLFLKKALAEGADYIATGHHARLRREITNHPEGVAIRPCGASKSQITNKSNILNSTNHELRTTNHKLLKGVDKNKDQSYFLWTLTQRQLKHCLFPIGNYTKPEVRKLAKKFGLPNWDKKDSQGVCFIGPLDMKGFLKTYIKPKTGKVVLTDSDKVIGTHDGIYYYTIGQRHGLNIGDGDGPYYVTDKDIKKNIIYVAKELPVSKLLSSMTINRSYAWFIVMSKNVGANKVSWIGVKPKLPLNCEIKIRYRSESLPAQILPSKLERGSPKRRPANQTLMIKFKRPARAVTPGQSAVFYRGKEVLGGGIIVDNP